MHQRDAYLCVPLELRHERQQHGRLSAESIEGISRPGAVSSINGLHARQGTAHLFSSSGARSPAASASDMGGAANGAALGARRVVARPERNRISLRTSQRFA